MNNYNSNVVESDKGPNTHYDLLYKSKYILLYYSKYHPTYSSLSR